MDHTTIEEQGWIDRYHQGDLSLADETRFEAHFVACAECQQALEIAASFRRGIKRVAAEEAAQRVVTLGFARWLRHRRARLMLVAAGVVTLLGLGVLMRENSQLARQLANADTAGTTAIHGPLAQPLVALTTTLLGTPRGDDGRPVVVDAGTPYAIAFDAGSDPRRTRYGVEIIDASGAIHYAATDLRPNDLEVIQLILPSTFLPAGDYRLRAHAFLPGEERVDLGDFPFRLTKGPA